MKIFRPTLLALLFISGSTVWADDVKLYDRAPSVEELQRQLTGDTPGVGKKTVRTRAIVFGDAPAPAPTAAEQPAAPAARRTTRNPPPHSNINQRRPAARPPCRLANGRLPSRSTSGSIARMSCPNRCLSLSRLPACCKKTPGVRLLIEGHTDSTGNAMRNMSLSRERAFSVMNYLVDRYRVDPMRLVPVGKGFSEPLGGAEPTNPKNRRVQFRILG